MRSLLKNLSYIAAGFAAVLLIAVLILFILGFRPFILMTSSMEPLYHQGSLCLVDTTVPLNDLAIGDTLVYRSSANSLVLHRLVDVESRSEDRVEGFMQGDANSSLQDIELCHINYVGREVLSIPGLGNFFMSFQRYVWWIVGVLLVFACVPQCRDFHGRESDKKAGCVG